MPVNFDLAISSPIHDEEVVAVAQELEAIGAAVIVEEREAEPQASLELLAAGALVVLITRKYFETILEEAAKDHYQVLKRAVSRLLGARKRYRMKTFVSSRSPNKPHSGAERVFSVSFVERPGALLKFVFSGESDDAHEGIALENLFALLEAYCRGGEDPRIDILRAMIESGPRAWRYVLIYDEKTSQWVPTDLFAAMYPVRNAASESGTEELPGREQS